MSVANSNKLLDVTFMSLSGGTFIYVACSEIIVNEFDKGKHQAFKAMFVLLGGTIITCLWFFGGHNHGHGGHDDHAGELHAGEEVHAEEGHEGHGHLLF